MLYIYTYIYSYNMIDYIVKKNETVPTILHIPSHTQSICEYLEKSLEVEGCIPNL